MSDVNSVHKVTYQPISSTRSAAYKHQSIGSALVEIMACVPFGAMLLSKPVLYYCYLDPSEQTYFFFKKNASKYIVCEMAAIMPRGDELSMS